MEVRQLTTEHERKIFAECLGRARATKGMIGTRETAGSKLDAVHLMFGNVYAVFERDCAPTEEMIAGFIFHDLASLPQSFSKPDLSHLPAKSVIEGGSLWSLSRGGAGIIRRVAPAMVGILQAEAVLLYPVCKPLDLTAPHRELGFEAACEPILNVFGETVEGEPIWIQPMVIQGAKLREYIRWGFDFLFASEAGRRSFRFESSYPLRAKSSASTAEIAKALPVAANGNGHHEATQNPAT
ncbi:MAG TPA: hypothetical protein VMT64_03455 [Candidatus Binataceae bacterium]|nr:hypothetical protein [Candidatus Binataceae bacterium]